MRLFNVFCPLILYVSFCKLLASFPGLSRFRSSVYAQNKCHFSASIYSGAYVRGLLLRTPTEEQKTGEAWERG